MRSIIEEKRALPLQTDEKLLDATMGVLASHFPARHIENDKEPLRLEGQHAREFADHEGTPEVVRLREMYDLRPPHANRHVRIGRRAWRHGHGCLENLG